VTPRYFLTEPRPDGFSYWVISDMRENRDLVMIHESFPAAEKIARGVFEHFIKLEETIDQCLSQL